jgi:hypothetical protein
VVDKIKNKMKKSIKKIFILTVIITCIIICLLYLTLCNGFSGFYSQKKHFNSPEINYFHGVVVNDQFIPIEGVIINNTNSPKITSKSDKKGYFELKDDKLNVNEKDILILRSNKFITDTLETMEEKYSDKESSIIYRFCKKNIDTIVMIKLKLK